MSDGGGGASKSRVLLGDLGPVVRLGMASLLAETATLEVFDGNGDGADIVTLAGRLRPDTVIIGLEAQGSLELGQAIQAAAPDAKIILWATGENRMEILDPGCPRPRQIECGVVARLLDELAERRSDRKRAIWPNRT